MNSDPGPYEPSARSLKISGRAHYELAYNTVRRIMHVLEDRQLVTADACAALAAMFIDLSASKADKVQALVDLGYAAKDLLARTGPSAQGTAQ